MNKKALKGKSLWRGEPKAFGEEDFTVVRKWGEGEPDCEDVTDKPRGEVVARLGGGLAASVDFYIATGVPKWIGRRN